MFVRVKPNFKKKSNNSNNDNGDYDHDDHGDEDDNNNDSCRRVHHYNWRKLQELYLTRTTIIWISNVRYLWIDI